MRKFVLFFGYCCCCCCLLRFFLNSFWCLVGSVLVVSYFFLLFFSFLVEFDLAKANDGKKFFWWPELANVYLWIWIEYFGGVRINNTRARAFSLSLYLEMNFSLKTHDLIIIITDIINIYSNIFSQADWPTKLPSSVWFSLHIHTQTLAKRETELKMENIIFCLLH